MDRVEQRRSVLHALRMISVATVEQIAARSGASLDDARRTLSDVAARGWATERTGRFAGWTLTAAGRVELDRMLAAELDETGGRAAVEDAYERFLAVNQAFLDLCSRWQLVDAGGATIANDHTDAARDRALIAELHMFHSTVTEISDDLGERLVRFRTYPPRFAHAISRLAQNDVDWFTKPLIDSYHTIWFELHEDLLATLGRTRSSEHPESTEAKGRS